MRCITAFLLFSFFVQTQSFSEVRVLAFGDSNTWGWIPNGGGKRFSDSERWSGVLQNELGEDYTVICDGLVARRTNIDGSNTKLVDGSFLNGAKTLPVAIARNAPVDLVILFLGTNDIQLGAERTAKEITIAVQSLAAIATESQGLLYSDYDAPAIWIIEPPALGDLSNSPLKGLFEIGKVESYLFSEAFAELSHKEGITVIDTDQLLGDSLDSDGIHMNLEAHQTLGKALARKMLKDGL